MIPGGLTALPEEASYKITSGEVLVGQFSSKSQTVLAFASHNAYQPQQVGLTIKSLKNVELFDRGSGKYRPLQVAGNTTAFEVPSYSVEMVRITH